MEYEPQTVNRLNNEKVIFITSQDNDNDNDNDVMMIMHYTNVTLDLP